MEPQTKPEQWVTRKCNGWRGKVIAERKRRHDKMKQLRVQYANMPTTAIAINNGDTFWEYINQLII